MALATLAKKVCRLAGLVGPSGFSARPAGAALATGGFGVGFGSGVVFGSVPGEALAKVCLLALPPR